MSSVLDLARPELRQLTPYVPGDFAADTLRLNANESPWRAPGDDTERGLNRYPPPRPDVLTEQLSAYYGVPQSEILLTRGSSEAIDVLIRTFCAAGRDSVVICPPTFDMYRLYAEIQGARILRVPLQRSDDLGKDFSLDVDGIMACIDQGAKLVFICSPNNPTGSSIASADIARVCEASTGRAVVVIDEAYLEFSSQPSARPLQQRFEHVVLLRTLSKFVSLAGVRCGAVIASAPVIELLGRVLPPYTFPTPSIELVSRALGEASLTVAEERVQTLRRERDRLEAALGGLPQVEKLWPSDANFVFLKVRDSERFVSRARSAGILLRVFANDPSLADCVRITVGRPEDNDRLLAAVTT
ncbi:MAG: histidinol-phosphate transaminase [Gammaproteobacteria bacterium]|nr:histidinol-phosphate transaminase [Gammaproteobacteria bacterium]MDH3506070.1 histidinol-phosphate transaminase [Gammaproteobacteria bacterium]